MDTGYRKEGQAAPTPTTLPSLFSWQDFRTRGPACCQLQPWLLKGGWRSPGRRGPPLGEWLSGVVSVSKNTLWVLSDFDFFYL